MKTKDVKALAVNYIPSTIMRIKDEKLVIASVLHLAAEVMLTQSPIKTLAQASAVELISKMQERGMRHKDVEVFNRVSRIMIALATKAVHSENLEELDLAVKYAESLVNGTVEVVEPEKSNDEQV